MKDIFLSSGSPPPPTTLDRAAFLDLIRSAVFTVPEGAVTTPRAIARVLGDERAEGAVRRLVRAACKGNTDAETNWCAQVALEGEADASVQLRRPNKIDTPRTAPLRELRMYQKELSARVIVHGKNEEDGPDPRWMVGLDVAYADSGERAWGAASIFALRDEPVHLTTLVKPARAGLPYIPGYLAFREYPALAPVLDRVERWFETEGRAGERGYDWDRDRVVYLVDGNGILHPREIGLASHIGVRRGVVTVGCAKRLLAPARVSRERCTIGGAEASPIRWCDGYGDHDHDHDRRIGYAVAPPPPARRPLYVSPGHGIRFERAVRLVRMVQRYRVPDPIRYADQAAGRAKRGEQRGHGECGEHGK